MNRTFLTAFLFLAPLFTYGQDDALPLVVPPAPVTPEIAVAEVSIEARVKMNVEWMYNNISGLESQRINCLLELNRSFLDSFSFTKDLDADKRLNMQQRTVARREESLKECLGKAHYDVLLELREKNGYKPGSAAKPAASATEPAIQAAPATSSKKGKSTPAAVPASMPSTAAVPATALSDRLEGEQ